MKMPVSNIHSLLTARKCAEEVEYLMIIWIHYWIKAATDCKTPGQFSFVLLRFICVCEHSCEIACLYRISAFTICFVWVHSDLCVFMCFCVHETLLKTSKCNVAATLLWKWIVGILYLSVPPFGPWNAWAYFPIMALSCSQLPRETCCPPRSAVLSPPPPLFTHMWGGRWRGKKGESLLYSAMSEHWWGTVIMQGLLFSLCTRRIVTSSCSYSLKLWNIA